MTSQTQRLLIIALSVVFLLGAVFVYFNLLSPAYDNVNQLRGQLASKKNDLENLQSVMSELKKRVNALAATGDEDRLTQMIPNGLNTSELVHQVSALASGSGLSVVALTPSLSPSREPGTQNAFLKPLGVVTLSAKLQGSYASMKQFLQSLENSIRIMDVQEINVTPERPREDRYLIEIRVNTYYH